MKNSAASILRNQVAAHFNIKPETVKLSGILPAEWVGHNTTGLSYVNHGDDLHTVVVFTNQGWFDITDEVVSETRWYNGNHDSSFFPTQYNLGEALNKIKASIPLFVVVQKWDDDELMNTTAYKVPDFESHFAKINEQDIARWQEWLTV